MVQRSSPGLGAALTQTLAQTPTGGWCGRSFGGWRMFGRWGRFVVRRPWWVIGGWLVGVALIIGFLPNLSDITSADQGSFLPDKYESVQALNLAKTAFPQQATSTAIVVVKRADGAALTGADQERVAQLASAIADGHITGVGTPATGPQAVAPNR